MNQPPSIIRRLNYNLATALILLWVTTFIGSTAISLHEINEIADSQMQQIAFTLQNTFTQASTNYLSNTPKSFQGSSNTGFAIWNNQGQLLASDDYGRNLPAPPQANGFHNSGSILSSGSARYFYLISDSDGLTIAVIQRWKERLSILSNALWVELGLMLTALPLLLCLCTIVIRRSLSPLTTLNAELAHRHIHNLSPISTSVPNELTNMVATLNHLLHRLEEAITREQQFTSDAAHELRSPLAALNVQAQALALSNKPDEYQHHITQIENGIAHTQHLIDQLLSLARLDNLGTLPSSKVLDWETIAQQVLRESNLYAREKYIRLKLIRNDTPRCQLGDSLLIRLMLRNLVDNAIRYSPTHTTVSLILDLNHISICDQGAGIAPQYIHRIGERFYRPPGQTQQGSGLGLSIVQRIAVLHGLTLHLSNLPEGGLCACLKSTSSH